MTEEEKEKVVNLVLADMLMHGTGFVCYTKEEGELIITRIDPATIRIEPDANP